MPPTGQPMIDFSNLSDADLSQMLKDYQVNVGPINAATRKTYERKLVQLKTGKLPPPSQTPVDDDDEAVQVRQPVEPQRRQINSLPDSTQSYASSLRDSDYSSSSSKSYVSSVRGSDFSASRSFGYSERHTDLSPDVKSRPSLSADRRTPSSYTPSSYSTPVKGPTATKVSKEKGIPLWLKLVAVAIVVFLIYLIYINMEPTAVNNIPEIQNKMEV